MDTQQLTFDKLPQSMAVLLEKVERMEAVLNQIAAAPAGPAADELVDKEEAAIILRMAPKSVSDLAAAGEIPHMKPAKRLLFLKSELLAWAKASRRKTNAEIEQEAADHVTTKNAA